MNNSASLIQQRAVLSEKCASMPLILYADNGSAMKGSTLSTKLNSLGISPSHILPRVSNANPYSEALFRTCKYHPQFPINGFDQIEDARQWVHHFVRWYKGEYRHSEICSVTSAQSQTSRLH